jgi:hypothetical protein
MAWQPGKSGNPNGSAGPKRFQAALDRALAQDDGKRLRGAIEKLLDAAAAGEVWAIQFLADRLDGKATEFVNINHAADPTAMSSDELAAEILRRRAGEQVPGAAVVASVH